MTAWLLLAAALLLILACGVFVAAEFSFVTVDRGQVDRAAAAGDAGAQGLQQALRTPVDPALRRPGRHHDHQPGDRLPGRAGDLRPDRRPARRGSGVPGRRGHAGRGRASAWRSAPSLTMIFGELVPKNLALAKPMAGRPGHPALPARVHRGRCAARSGCSTARPTRSYAGSGIEPQEELRSARSSTELASLIQRSADRRHPRRRDRRADGAVGGVRHPHRRRDHDAAGAHHAASTSTTARIAVIELARETGHSRFPVLDAEDTVVGTVHVKHAVALPVHERSTTRVKHLMVKPIVVPDSLRLDPLLALLREDGFQMAVVLDEYGGYAGIVTLEDVIEEIVGDISDEHDRLSDQRRAGRDGTWSLSGLLRPDEVEDLTGIELPEHEDYDTIAGLVLQVLGRVPGRRRHRRGRRCPTATDADEPREQLVVADRRAHGRAAHRPAHAAAARAATTDAAPRGSAMSSGTALARRAAACCSATRSSSAPSSRWSPPAAPRSSRAPRPARGWPAPRCARWRTSRW